MATVETDPLCGGSHPIKLSQGGKEFYYCAPAHSTVWLTNPLIKRRVLENGGSSPRGHANPTQSYGAAVPYTTDEEEDFL